MNNKTCPGCGAPAQTPCDYCGRGRPDVIVSIRPRSVMEAFEAMGQVFRQVGLTIGTTPMLKSGRRLTEP